MTPVSDAEVRKALEVLNAARLGARGPIPVQAMVKALTAFLEGRV